MLVDYLRAVARHTYLLLVGALGLILTAVGIVAPAYVAVAGAILLLVGVVGAQFQVWRDMRWERDKERAERAKDAAAHEAAERRWSEREAALLAKLEGREKRKALRESLGEFFAQGEEVRASIERAGQPVGHSLSGPGYTYLGSKPKETTEETLRGSFERADEWGEQVASFLTQYLGSSYAVRFRSQVGTIERIAPRMSGKEHPAKWAMVDRRLQVLAEIIKEVGDDLIGT